MTIKQLTLSLIVAAGAMTATDAQAFSLKSADPASGSTVDQISKINLVWNEEDFDTPVGTPTIKDADGNELSVKFSTTYDYYSPEATLILNPAVSDPGTYTITIPEGYFTIYEHPDKKNEVTTLTYTVPEPTTLTKLKPTFTPNNRNQTTGTDEIYNVDFTYVYISLSGGNFEVDPSKVTIKADGEDVACERTADGSMIKLSGISINKACSVTVTVPEGTFYDKYYKNSNGQVGKTNETTEYVYKLISISGQPDDGTPLVINKLTLIAPDGTTSDLLNNGTLATLTDGYTLNLETSKDALAGLIYCDIIDNNPREEDQANIVKITFRKDNNGKFTFSGFSSKIIYKFTEGHTYTLKFDAIDTDKLAEALRIHYGQADVIVSGTLEGYKYSPVKMIKSNPEVDTTITDKGQTFQYVFDGPVNLKAEQNEGQGSTSGVADCFSNTKKDVWYVNLTNDFMSKQTGDFQLILTVKDLNGLVVEGNNGYEENSTFQMQYQAFFDNAELVISPAEGTVESIQNFRGNGNYGYTLTPLETPFGYEVTRISNENEDMVRYYQIGGVIKSEAEWEAEGKELWDMQPVYTDIKLKREITAPGMYYLHVPLSCFVFGQQYDSKGTPEAYLKYLIEGEPTFNGQTIKEGDKVHTANIIGFSTASYAAVKEGTRMNIRKDGSNWISAPIAVNYTEDGAFIFADFSHASEEGTAPVFEDGVEYQIRIGSGAIYLPETDMAFGTVQVNFLGSDAIGEVVKLTQTIAGHSVSVASVAKGSSSEIALTPADNWKVASVKFNDEDVTENVKDNAYITPAIEADSKLEVAFEYDGVLNVTTGVDDVVTDFELKVYSENGIITIEGLKAGMNVKLFTIDGAMLKAETAAESILRFEVEGGTYVVLVSDGTKTEAVKVYNK